MHPHKMIEESEVNRKKKKEVLRKIKKEKTRNHDFYCTTKHAGRGVNGSLKCLMKKTQMGK